MPERSGVQRPNSLTPKNWRDDNFTLSYPDFSQIERSYIGAPTVRIPGLKHHWGPQVPFDSMQLISRSNTVQSPDPWFNLQIRGSCSITTGTRFINRSAVCAVYTFTSLSDLPRF